MSAYIYNDEDNVPMSEDLFDQPPRYHNVTTYTFEGEMRAADRGEPLPFTDPPEDGCWNCLEYDGNRCHKEWNNNDECYYVPERDDKEPTDRCEFHDKDESIRAEEFFDDADT